jgi:hypothetical protein
MTYDELSGSFLVVWVAVLAAAIIVRTPWAVQFGVVVVGAAVWVVLPLIHRRFFRR